MFDLCDNSIVAVDGGGTRCRLALVSGADRVSVEVGAANVSSDFQGAIAQIYSGLEMLSDRASLPLDDLLVVPAFLGLAGVTGDHMAQEVAASLPFRSARVWDDRPAALRGALGREDGAVVHCGTGSFLGIQISGRGQCVGGWGAVLGDQASAQWVGRKALGAALDAEDGLRAPSEMTDRLLVDYAGSAGIVAFAGRVGPAGLGQVARLVTAHAAQGDPVARDVLQAAANYVVETLLAIQWHADMPICLTGGIAPFFAPYLPEEMQSSLRDPKGEPLEGAISLAQDFSRELAR